MKIKKEIIDYFTLWYGKLKAEILYEAAKASGLKLVYQERTKKQKSKKANSK